MNFTCKPEISHGELRRLILSYDAYYQMADDGSAWRRVRRLITGIRSWSRQLRAEGHGPEIDALKWPTIPR